MAKKRVYVESSVISYLTARPSRDWLKRAMQRLTHEWWEQRHLWELFVSNPVMDEIEKGDPEAALKRINVVAGMTRLPETSEAQGLAAHLIAVKAVPEGKYDDALHVSIATVHGMDNLVTWNQTHLFNPERIEALYKAIRETGHKPAVLLRPDNMLMEVRHAP